MYMSLRKIIVFVVAGFELLVGYASVGQARGSRCEREDFPMIPIQSWARSVWTGACAEPQLRYLWEVKMGNPKGMPIEKIEKETVEKWIYASKDVYRDRPFFPTFGKEGSDEVFRAPVQLFTGCIPDPAGYQIMGICRSNPEKINSRISTAIGQRGLSELVGDTSTDFLILAENSGLAEPAFEGSADILAKNARPNATIDVLDFELASGRTIQVTKNHRFVAPSGEAVRAADLEKSAAVVAADGHSDTIVGIKPAKYVGPTFVLASKRKIHKMVITATEGFLDATNWHPIDDLDLTDKRMARNLIPDHLVAD